MVILQTDPADRNNYINEVSARFNLEVRPCDIDAVGRDYMKKIDGAEIIDENLGTIKTPLGITSMWNLSSGLKTLLYVRKLIQEGNTDKPVFVGSAGENALELIFKEADNTGLPMVIRHAHVPDSYGMTFSINGKICTPDEYHPLYRLLGDEVDKQNGYVRRPM